MFSATVLQQGISATGADTTVHAIILKGKTSYWKRGKAHLWSSQLLGKASLEQKYIDHQATDP